MIIRKLKVERIKKRKRKCYREGNMKKRLLQKKRRGEREETRVAIIKYKK